MKRKKKDYLLTNVGVRIDPRLKKILYIEMDNISKFLREAIEEYAKKKGLVWDE